MTAWNRTHGNERIDCRLIARWYWLIDICFAREICIHIAVTQEIVLKTGLIERKGSSWSYSGSFLPMKTSIFCSEIFSGVRSLTDRTPEIVGRPSDKIHARKNRAKTKHREIPIQMEKIKPSGDFSECKMGPMELLSGPTVYRIQCAIRWRPLEFNISPFVWL